MRFRLATTVAVTAALTASVAPVAIADTTARFTVSNITDFHGRWKHDDKAVGAELLKCNIDKAAEGKNAHIFTSSGDNIGASPFEAMLLDDTPTIDVLNQMGLKVSAVGNHEFDRGYADLRDRVLKEAEFEYLGANVEGADELAPYVIEELDGVKVAFIGAVSEDTPNLVSPSGIEGLSFTNPVKVTNEIADKLTASGEADVVVSLMHEGNINTDEFSNNVDVVFMGHTHQSINRFDTNAQTRPVVLQATEYSNGLANVDFAYDRANDTVTFEKVETLKAEDLLQCQNDGYPEIKATIDAALEQSAVEGAKQVGTLPQALVRGADEGKDTGSNRGVESKLNNFIADVTRWGVAQNSSVTPDIGVMNAGGLRADLPKGEVSYAAAFAVQPFGNENTYIELKGKDFVDALEQQYKGEDAKRPVLSLGVSNNVSYTYDPKAPQGEKITSVYVDGKPIDMEKTYIVAGSTFLLGGGDGFEAFTRGTEMANLGYVDINALLEYFQAHENPTARTSQSNVGVHIPEPLRAGEEATIELSSLMYTDNDPVKTVTVQLGREKVTVDIEKTFGRPQYNDAGQATVKLNVPARLKGTQKLRITTDQGTDVTVPVEVESKPSAIDVNPVTIILGLLGALSLLTLVFAFPIDAVLGPIAKL
ncbi:hypothetical protein A0K93_04960 [Corynebacterium sp. BCW_4722]|nr:hypothetical protein A0K93_04960 [Corynebacterium sp. BCW_4722]